MLDSILYFHCHVDFVYSQEIRALGLIPYITYNFSSLNSLFYTILQLGQSWSMSLSFGIILH
jgi:hypothetical protein